MYKRQGQESDQELSYSFVKRHDDVFYVSATGIVLVAGQYRAGSYTKRGRDEVRLFEW